MYLWNHKEKDFTFLNINKETGKQLLNQNLIFNGVIWGLCTKGKIKFRINYKEYDLLINEIFVLFPEHIFTLLDYSEDMEIRFVITSPDCIQKLPIIPSLEILQNMTNQPCIRLSDNDKDDIIGLYTIIEHNSKKAQYSENIRTSLFSSLILIIISLFQSNGKDGIQIALSRHEKLTKHFFDLMLLYYKSKRNVSFYADKLCVTPKYLSSNIKDVTGYTAQQWIMEITVTEAKRHLLTSEKSIQQISEELNFQTTSSFVRFFKNHTGLTPLAYRKQ